jgi:hypothetical protein
MKTIEKLAVFAVVDGGFVVSVKIPKPWKKYFEGAHWRRYLDGQIESWHGCAMAAIRTGEPDLVALGAKAGLSRWEKDRPALESFRGHRLEPIQLQFRHDPACEWGRLGIAIGVSPVKLLQAALAVRYEQAKAFEALDRLGEIIQNLLPCPNCGSQGRLFTDCPRPVTYCRKCDGIRFYGDTGGEASREWNIYARSGIAPFRR